MAAESKNPTHVPAEVAAGEPGLTIRPARPEDALAAGGFIYLPMGHLADFIFGENDPGRAREVLTWLFAKEMNRFSYQFSDMAELNGQPVALLLAYPGAMLESFAIPTGKQLLRIYGWKRLAQLVGRTWPLIWLKEAEPDEFYIFTVAVAPDRQGQGIGRRLLAHAETKAHTAGLGKASLGVSIGNDSALRFYERCGYQILKTVPTPALERRIGYPGFHRLVKNLRAASATKTPPRMAA